jgi:hypothetical protein
LSSSWWWSSWLVSAGVLFFDLFCGGIVSCFLAEKRWAPMFRGWKVFSRIPQRVAGWTDTRTRGNRRFIRRCYFL